MEVLHFRDFTIQLKSDWPCCLPIHLLGGFFSLSSTFPRSLHIQMSTYLGSKPGVEWICSRKSYWPSNSSFPLWVLVSFALLLVQFTKLTAARLADIAFEELGRSKREE